MKFKEESMLESINGKGAICGIIVWVGMMVWMALGTSCARFNGCGYGDIFLTAILAVGMLVPAFFIAVFLSIFFVKK